MPRLPGFWPEPVSLHHRTKQTMPRFAPPCPQLCFSPGSCDVLVSGGYDQAVKVWDCRSRSIDAIQVGCRSAWGCAVNAWVWCWVPGHGAWGMGLKAWTASCSLPPAVNRCHSAPKRVLSLTVRCR